MKNEKGITLVALVMVMFVLLVLAGVSISLVISEQLENNNNNNNKKVVNQSYYEDLDENEVIDTDSEEQENLVEEN